jgi:hypothetical protein
VKEAVPLSRGNLVVHGDAPRRSLAETDRIPSPDVRAVDNFEVQHESAFNEDELPPPAMTRNLLSVFRSMEDTSRAPPTPETTERHMVASRSNLRRSPSAGRSTAAVQSDHYASELDQAVDTMEYAAGSGEFENDPVYNANVVRESDQSDLDVLPVLGTTRSLLAKFQHQR